MWKSPKVSKSHVDMIIEPRFKKLREYGIEKDITQLDHDHSGESEYAHGEHADEDAHDDEDGHDDDD